MTRQDMIRQEGRQVQVIDKWMKIEASGVKKSVPSESFGEAVAAASGSPSPTRECGKGSRDRRKAYTRNAPQTHTFQKKQFGNDKHHLLQLR